jgi:molybdenum cofactor synthesis domain-containing protein
MPTSYTCGVLTVSDKGASGARLDTSGPAIQEMVRGAGFQITAIAMVPDEVPAITAIITEWADHGAIDLLLTTGGTGLSPRDVTPEATRPLLEREIPGISEAMRLASLRQTPYAALSRGVAGIRKASLVINLPGSERAATENLAAVLPILHHAIEKIRGGNEDCQHLACQMLTKSES